MNNYWIQYWIIQYQIIEFGSLHPGQSCFFETWLWKYHYLLICSFLWLLHSVVFVIDNLNQHCKDPGSTFNHGSSLGDFEPITLSSHLLHRMAVGRKMKGVPHVSLWILQEQTRYKQINKTLINHFQRKSKNKLVDLLPYVLQVGIF